jgi:hypothetical protein
MTSSQTKPKKSYARRISLLALFVIVLCAGYAGAWHYGAGLIGERANAAVRDLNTAGRRASCENLDVGGFPFRLGVFCNRVMYIDQAGGVAVRAGALRSAAQVYAPRQIIAELDGPAAVELPGLMALDVAWESLRASSVISLPLPERLSLEATNVVAHEDGNGAADAPALEIRNGQLHMRQREADVDIALRFSGLQVGEAFSGGLLLPELEGLADIAITDGTLPQVWAGAPRGLSGEVRQIELVGGEGAALTLSGPFTVREDGLIDAQLQIGVREAQELGRLLVTLFPDEADQIRSAMGIVAAMGDTPSLPLQIDGGRMRMGFISLGQLPPL